MNVSQKLKLSPASFKNDSLICAHVKQACLPCFYRVAKQCLFCIPLLQGTKKLYSAYAAHTTILFYTCWCPWSQHQQDRAFPHWITRTLTSVVIGRGMYEIPRSGRKARSSLQKFIKSFRFNFQLLWLFLAVLANKSTAEACYLYSTK